MLRPKYKLQYFSYLHQLRQNPARVGVSIAVIAILIGLCRVLFGLPLTTATAIAQSSPEPTAQTLSTPEVTAIRNDGEPPMASDAAQDATEPALPRPVSEKVRHRKIHRTKTALAKRRSRPLQPVVSKRTIAAIKSPAASVAMAESSIAFAGAEKEPLLPIAGEANANSMSDVFAHSEDASASSSVLALTSNEDTFGASRSKSVDLTAVTVLGTLASVLVREHEKESSAHHSPMINASLGSTRPVPEWPTTIILATMIFCGLTFIVRRRMTHNAL